MGGQPIVGLAVQPPPQPKGPLQMAEGALSVQAMIAQDRLRRQAEQQNQVTLQQEQLKLQQQQEAEQQSQQEQADAQKFRQSYQEANGNWGDAIARAKTAGVGPQFIAKAEAANLDHVTKLAALDKSQHDLLERHNEDIAKVALATKNAPPDKKLQVFTQGRNQLILHGVAQEKDIDPALPSDDQLDGYIANGMHLKDNLEQARKIQEDAAKLPGERAKATTDQLGAIGQLLGNTTNQIEWTTGLAAAKKSGIEPALLAGYSPTFTPAQAEMARKNGMAPSALANAPVERQALASFMEHPPRGYKPTPLEFLRYQKSITPAIQNFYASGGGLGVPGAGAGTPPAAAPGPGVAAGGGAPAAAASAAAPAPATTTAPAPAPKAYTSGGQPISKYTMDNVPPQIRGQVKELLDYRGKMPPANSRAAVPQAIRQWVTELDPQFDETTFDGRKEILKNYTKSAGEGQIGAINTAVGHLGELYTAVQALDQNNLPVLHRIASLVGAATGGDATSTYEGILHRVGPELTSAYLKGGGTADERGANEGDFSLKKGQKQIIGNIAEAANLLNSKLASQRKNWNETFRPYRDQDQFDNRFITPEAKDTIERLSKMAPTNRGGGVTIPPGAPPAPAEDGHKLKVNGVVIAVSKGGQWQTTQP